MVLHQMRPLARPIPRSTRDLSTDPLAIVEGYAINLGLLVDKYQPWDFPQDHQHGGPCQLRWEIEDHGNWVWSEKGAKGNWLNALSSLTPTRWDEILLKDWLERWENTVTQKANHLETLICIDRLVVGLGAESTLETSITLHSRYGFPYIPGSALKGVCRSVAIYELAGAWGIPILGGEEISQAGNTPLDCLDRLIESPSLPKNVFEDALARLQSITRKYRPEATILSNSITDVFNDPLYLQARSIFGWQGNAGDIVFHDSPPSELPKMAVEIMTPHFPAYYEGRKSPEGQLIPPQDDQDPTPIPYLVVEKGSKFRFAISARVSRGNGYLDKAWEWLKFGLYNLGVGAKTSSGMGLFGRPLPVPVQEARQESPQAAPDYLTYRSPKHD